MQNDDAITPITGYSSASFECSVAIGSSSNTAAPGKAKDVAASTPQRDVKNRASFFILFTKLIDLPKKAN